MDIKENTLSNRSKADVMDGRSISSIKSTRKSSVGDKPSKVLNIDSEDISLSQLELMANKKKLNKPEEISLASDIQENINKIKTASRVRSVTTSSSSSSTSTSTDSTRRKQKKERLIQKENKDEDIRKEKSEFLFKFNKMNVKERWSSLRLDMNCSLDEIKNEYERVRNEIQTERSVAFFKRMLLLGVQGVEMMNNRFDPLGVDLDGWSEAMGYSMENQEYDEVMAELYEKYKGRGQMSPEMKLIFMIISSATMFTISKKITKMDSSNAFASFIGSMMGNKGSTAPPQFQQPQQFQQPSQQQLQQQLEQQFYQQQVQQQQYQQQMMQQQYQQQMMQQNQQQYHQDIITETTEDVRPSKLQDPEVFQDEIDLDNILKTMNQRKREKERAEVTETSDDILKSITMTQKKGRRGRPKKTGASLQM